MNKQQILDLLSAVNSGLEVVKRVADTPGVSAIPYASTLSSAISAVQQLYKAGMDIEPQVTAIIDTFSDPNVSETDMAALDAEIAAWSAKLDAPLPQAEPGEPE
jgi:hypothetical protein